MRVLVSGLMIFFSLVSLAQKSSEKLITTISVSKAKEIIANNDVIILDVRTPEEFASGHIQNAVNINYYDQDFSKRVESINKRKKIIVYCAVGGRSGQALTKMDALGFQYVLNMKGGYNAWKAQQ